MKSETKRNDFECVIMTTPAAGTPHLGALLAANPGMSIHVCMSEDGQGAEDRTQRWRNCDRNIRRWWRESRETVTTDAVLFLEYDVFCDVDISRMADDFMPPFGILGARIISGLTGIRKFWPFAEIPRLPREMQALACATAPLAVLLISRPALDAILRPEYDPVFADDIFCETRLPTVIRHAGFMAGSMHLPQVGCTPCEPTFPGVWHPVKTSVESDVSDGSKLTHEPPSAKDQN
jgi:hypothetical protein